MSWPVALLIVCLIAYLITPIERGGWQRKPPRLKETVRDPDLGQQPGRQGTRASVGAQSRTVSMSLGGSRLSPDEPGVPSSPQGKPQRGAGQPS